MDFLAFVWCSVSLFMFDVDATGDVFWAVEFAEFFLFLRFLVSRGREKGLLAGAMRDDVAVDVDGNGDGVSVASGWRGWCSAGAGRRSIAPAFLFRASLWNTGQEVLFAGCASPQFAQVAGSSRGRGQSLAVCSSPQRTQAKVRWQLWLECLNFWHR